MKPSSEGRLSLRKGSKTKESAAPKNPSCLLPLTAMVKPRRPWSRMPICAYFVQVLYENSAISAEFGAETHGASCAPLHNAL